MSNLLQVVYVKLTSCGSSPDSIQQGFDTRDNAAIPTLWLDAESLVRPRLLHIRPRGRGLYNDRKFDSRSDHTSPGDLRQFGLEE
jgi:hypothetical protein